MPVKLTPRLATACRYVRGGTPVADIGTDHAYLPISLCEAGILSPAAEGGLCAIAADINHGPVERARIHIEAAGLSDRILTVKTDGLCGLEVYDPTDILIFGMGGELIASILAAAPWVRQAGKRLILQPMTHADRLRLYLWEAGFFVVGETISREGDRLYQTICAEWDGRRADPPTPAELAVGDPAHRRADPEEAALYAALIDRTIRAESAAAEARRRAGQDTSSADALLLSLARLRETIL